MAIELLLPLLMLVAQVRLNKNNISLPGKIIACKNIQNIFLIVIPIVSSINLFLSPYLLKNPNTNCIFTMINGF